VILIWVKFLICVVLILFFGTKLARYGDVIAEKTGLSGIWVGLLLLAIVTSLPEIITGFSAIIVVGDPGGPDLAMGTIFGSNALNLFIIALLDITYRRGPLLTKASNEHKLSAGLGILLIAFAGASIFLSTRVWEGGICWVGIYSLVLVILYLLGSRWIFRRERNRPSVETISLRYKNISSRRAYLGFGIVAIAIIGTGTWLAMVGDDIAVVTGLGTTFVGSLFLAITTSLPELVVCFAALRIGAVDMAIADVLGSNMFNMGIGVASFDLFYGSASIFSAASQTHIITTATVVLMSLIVVAGLTFQTKRKTPIAMSWYAPVLLVVYVTGAYFIFHMGT